MKYTKGPWTMPDTGDKVWAKELEIPEPQVWVDYDDVDREEAEANCRLIVCAPELLESLKTLIDVCDGNYRELTSEMQQLCDRAEGK